jgi:hypothetical protein
MKMVKRKIENLEEIMGVKRREDCHIWREL